MLDMRARVAYLRKEKRVNEMRSKNTTTQLFYQRKITEVKWNWRLSLLHSYAWLKEIWEEMNKKNINFDIKFVKALYIDK